MDTLRRIGYGIDASLTHGSIMVVGDDLEPIPVLRWPSPEIGVTLKADSTTRAVISFFRYVGQRFAELRPIPRDETLTTALIDFDLTSVHWVGQAGSVVRLALGLGILRESLSIAIGNRIDMVRPSELRVWLGLPTKATKQEVWQRITSYLITEPKVFRDTRKKAEDDKDAAVLAYMALLCGGSTDVIFPSGPPIFPQVVIPSGETPASGPKPEASPSHTSGRVDSGSGE